MHKPIAEKATTDPAKPAAGMLELGVCYYPEQWPRALWEEDARRMAALGLTWVRIGEFAWSHIEPRPGDMHWGWMDEAIDVLGRAGLKVILGTPTAAPPKWLVDRHPDILPVDAEGRPRKFGARRHYCFSSRRYRIEAARIAEAMAERYGHHADVHAWQIDNEYGDHDTVHSYSPEATLAFRAWLAARYESIEALNAAWGTAFWSMHYNGFDEIDLPNLLVEEPSPTHLVDYFRFSSDQVRAFNRVQVDILRKHAPGKPITHNFMSQNSDFDHHALGADIDIASWDVYPMGGLVNGRLGEADKARYLRQGDPDLVSFHHDLYRAVGRGRVWVMEQQPGPVNWAAHNQSPADGMVRLWTWLAYAHGVDMVSYFRWRQAPFAQEQFHAGLLLPNSEADQAFREVEAVLAERSLLPVGEERQKARVAFLLDYDSRYASRALPQGRSYNAAHVAADWYAALSRLGVDVDFIGQHSDLDGYSLVVAPDLLIADPDFINRLAASGARALFGPRSGSKSRDMHIPADLPPGPLACLLDLRVLRVESLPPYHQESILYGNSRFDASGWRETVRTKEEVLAAFDGHYRAGAPAIVGNDKARYCAVLPEGALLMKLMEDSLRWAGVAATPDLGDLRLARRGRLRFAFNFGLEPLQAPAPADARVLVGSREVAPADLCIWMEE